MEMESSLKMVLHSIIITIVLYLVMVNVFNQTIPSALDKSILIGGILLVYMVLFGHNLPTKLNPNIY